MSTRWPDELTGRNSVIPCTSATTARWSMVTAFLPRKVSHRDWFDAAKPARRREKAMRGKEAGYMGQYY